MNELKKKLWENILYKVDDSNLCGEDKLTINLLGGELSKEMSEYSNISIDEFTDRSDALLLKLIKNI